MTPTSASKPLSPDWKSWPRLSNRQPRRGLYPGSTTLTRHEASKDQFVIDDAAVLHDAICAAIATEFLPLLADPNFRLGRFSTPTGPTNTPSIRIEYHMNEWMVFTADIWTGVTMDSMLIVVDHWSYLSGSWFGRHLAHPDPRVFLVLYGFALLPRSMPFLFLLMLWILAGWLILGHDWFFGPWNGTLDTWFGQISGSTARFLWLAPLYAWFLAPYIPSDVMREESAHTLDEFAVRVRSGISCALDRLGIPSSAVHHSTG